MWKKIIAVVLVVLVLYILSFFVKPKTNMIYGASFNWDYADYLGLDPKETFRVILDDWNFKYVRLGAQWDEIEAQRGKYDFTKLDYLMDEAGKRNAKVVLAVGRKIPRWPECHTPDWALNLSDDEYLKALFSFTGVVAEHYKNHPALEIWQVENEPFLAFGSCRNFSEQNLKDELALVKKVDSTHPTLVTDSGELSFWTKTAHAGDFFGTTMYRVVWNHWLGYFSYNLVSPLFYRFKLWAVGRPLDQAFIVELQGEPWSPDTDLKSLPLKEQYRSLDLKQLKKNLSTASRVGVPRAYLWGAEWWYYLAKQGANEIPDYIKTLTK